MRYLLSAVDGSEWSDVACRHATDLACALGLSVRSLAVVPPEALQGTGLTADTIATSAAVLEGEHLAHRAVAEWFQTAQCQCDAAGVGHERVVDVGPVAERLLAAASTARLVVLGMHGADANRHHRPIGTIAHAMLRSCIKPMLIARREYRPIQRIVVGWDGRPEAGHAAEMAGDIARATQAEVHVVSGAPDTSPLAQTCGRVAAELVASGVAAYAHVVSGDAPGILYAAARELSADLIAIGGRMKGPIAALWSGGAWQDIVEQADQPVLLWR